MSIVFIAWKQLHKFTPRLGYPKTVSKRRGKFLKNNNDDNDNNNNNNDDDVDP